MIKVHNKLVPYYCLIPYDLRWLLPKSMIFHYVVIYETKALLVGYAIQFKLENHSTYKQFIYDSLGFSCLFV